jgi:predicted HTH transcriptional regulator
MKHDNRSQEVKRAIEEALGRSKATGGEEALQVVLEALEKEKIFSRYHNDDVIPLLATPGRILAVLADDPTMTQRAIAVYLGLSESMIDRAMKSLISAGIITKTKVKRQNIYKINNEVAREHPDIRHFFAAITKMNQQETVEEDPF